MFAKLAAVLIFVVMFGLIIWDKIERHKVTLMSGLATMVFVFILGLHSFDALWKTLNVSTIFTKDFWYHVGEAAEETAGINWATIIFICGMMIMVEGMAEAGFFR